MLPEEVHSYVEQHGNCEDIALQMMATGMTGAPPVAVQVCDVCACSHARPWVWLGA